MTQTIADLHSTWGWIAVGIAGLVGLWGIGLRIASRNPPRLYWVAVGVGMTAMLAQVGLGLIMFGQGLRPGTFHVFYGIVIVITFSLTYVYRIQLAKRPALAYGLLMLFVMGLGIRAILSFEGP